MKEKFNSIAYNLGISDEETLNMTPFDMFCYYLDIHGNAYIAKDLVYQEVAHQTLSILYFMADNVNKLSDFNSILNKFLDRYAGLYGSLKS